MNGKSLKWNIERKNVSVEEYIQHEIAIKV